MLRNWRLVFFLYFVYYITTQKNKYYFRENFINVYMQINREEMRNLVKCRLLYDCILSMSRTRDESIRGGREMKSATDRWDTKKWKPVRGARHQ